MDALDYRSWQQFTELMDRAKTSCEMAGNFAADHFMAVHEKVEIGSGAKRERENFSLSRYACYLVAMNGDTSVSLLRPQFLFPRRIVFPPM